MARKKSGLLGLFFNSRSASLTLPLVVATIFSFGYILWHQPDAGAPTASTSESRETKETVSLPSIPLAEQSYLPLIDSDGHHKYESYTEDRLGSPANTSPQSGAVPNNSSSQSPSNSNTSATTSATKTTQKNIETPVVKVMLPLLP